MSLLNRNWSLLPLFRRPHIHTPRGCPLSYHPFPWSFSGHTDLVSHVPTHSDVSSCPVWVGTTQRRTFSGRATREGERHPFLDSKGTLSGSLEGLCLSTRGSVKTRDGTPVHGKSPPSSGGPFPSNLKPSLQKLTHPSPVFTIDRTLQVLSGWVTS